MDTQQSSSEAQPVPSSVPGLPKRGKRYEIWLAVRVSVVAENSEQADHKAFDTVANVIAAAPRVDGADGEAPRIVPPLVHLNEVAVHVLNRMSEPTL